ncbi:unnamed protein product, partial [Mesorhabditis spiculigera]
MKSSEDEAKRCAYVLPKKQRKCRMLVKEGQLYCGEHAAADPDNKDRIPCPNDPKHTVKLSELEVHLRERCNSRLIEDPWIVKDLNAINGEVASFACIDRRPSKEELISLVERLEKLESIDQLPTCSQLSCPLVDARLEQQTDLGPLQRKHLVQLGSIIGHLTAAELLMNESSSSVFELGAGKAHLAYWMSKVAPLAHFLLVDRSGSRNKYDKYAIRENPDLVMTRLRCSIEHLDLSKVDALEGQSSLLAVQKHFCGSATDAGIRCLWNGVNRGLDLTGFVLVPCCHHKMRYAEYVGCAHLQKFGFDNEVDFSALRHISSWSTCGMEEEQPQGNTDSQSEPKKPKIETPTEEENTKELPWSRPYRAFIGRRAKLLLEEGRAEHLRQLGYEVEMFEYVNSKISPENLLLLGKKKKD